MDINQTDDTSKHQDHLFLLRQARLGALCDKISGPGDLEENVQLLESAILGILAVERYTVYEKTEDGRKIYSRCKSGNSPEVIRVDIGPSSISGFVAMSHMPVLIHDVYDVAQVKAIHSRLNFDYQFDQVSGFLTRSVLAVPIMSDDTVLGVLQLINRTGSRDFDEFDIELTAQLAAALAKKLKDDRSHTAGPFEYLIVEEVISKQTLEEAEKKAMDSELSIAYVLRESFDVSDEQLGKSLEQYFQVPYMGYDPEVILPPELMEALNFEFLTASCWVPIGGDYTRPVIMIDNPNDKLRIMDIQRILSADGYEFVVGVREDILRYLGIEPAQDLLLDGAVSDDVRLGELVSQLDSEREDGEGGTVRTEGAEGELIDENAATVVRLVNKVIADAVVMKASDIHLEPGLRGENGVVRYRIDGVCKDILSMPPHYMRYVIARVKIMSKIDIAERRLPQDGKIACKMQGKPLELRVATLPTVCGEGAIMRILAAGDPLPFEKLNLVKRNEAEILKMIEHPHGIVLVVGPTGSGKTTTLHALIKLINTPDRKILTAEDPVEITQPRLQQVQIHHQIGLDFSRALRSFLRSDPDVILIGEMRDKETAHAGIEASLTGHLVFSTLHTNSAAETVTRLLDMDMDPMNFADALIGVVAQRLVRTLCEECKEAYQPGAEEKDHLVALYGKDQFDELGVDLDTVTLYRPSGCDACEDIGYKGRTGIHEVLTSSPEMKELIATAPHLKDVRNLAVAQGMRSLMQDGIAKVLKGQMDLDQVRRVALTS
ncbi:MAG: GspE/PulE family protein [Lentisphaeria bacterium]|nr:GspE/PulE family protein [Lentisphaeria bacterium]